MPSMKDEVPEPTTDRRIHLAWILFAVGVGLWAATVIAYGVATPDDTGEWGGAGFLPNLPYLLMVLSFDVVGVLIVTRRPENPIGWIVLAIGVSWSAGDAVGAISSYGLEHGWRGADVLEAVLQPLWVPPISLLIYLVLLFPDGHLPSPRWRWFARTVGIGISVVSVAILLAPGSFADTGHPQVANPLGIDALEGVLHVLLAGLLIIPIGMVGAAVALVRRYRRSAGAERQQMKWLSFAAAIVAAVYAVVMPVSLIYQDAFTPGWVLVMRSVSLATFALIPIAIGFAVLRYRLYDIDVVINRTIVFGTLAVFIGAVYVTVVVVLGDALGATTTNPVLSIAATALVALLFEPVRVRVQQVANQLVYGARATPYEVLSRFSERIGGTYATEDVLPRTARVIAEGTAAERVEVWLRVGDALRSAATWPSDSSSAATLPLDPDGSPSVPGADTVVAVRRSGELLGAVSVTKRRGDAMTPAETELLADLAGQAGLVLANVRLTAELQGRLDEIARRSEELRASRQRIVTTQDAERRRLERNIHDGAQQHLVALAVKLRLTRSVLTKDPERAAAILEEIWAEVDLAIETLSSLALGIYPPVLEELGIAAALESQARVGAVPVTVRADEVDRQPIETEAAVYFCCLEAIQNAAKYARASSVEVTLGHDGPNLRFEVRDDGVGFDAASVTTGSGLQGMSDRLSAVGGSVEISSTPGGGTVVRGRVPAAVLA
jgi:signal transduction histidine kinase